MIRRQMRVLAVAAGLAAMAGCGGGGDNTPTGTPPGGGGGGGSTSNSIAVADNSFTPRATTVPSGTTGTWTWGGAAHHNVTFDDGAASATQITGTYARTFSAAGTFNYHCTIHGTGMSGSVTVQ